MHCIFTPLHAPCRADNSQNWIWECDTFLRWGHDECALTLLSRHPNSDAGQSSIVKFDINTYLESHYCSFPLALRTTVAFALGAILLFSYSCIFIALTGYFILRKALLSRTLVYKKSTFNYWISTIGVMWCVDTAEWRRSGGILKFRFRLILAGPSPCHNPDRGHGNWLCCSLSIVHPMWILSQVHSYRRGQQPYCPVADQKSFKFLEHSTTGNGCCFVKVIKSIKAAL